MDSLVDDMNRCRFTETTLVISIDSKPIDFEVSTKLKEEFRKKRKRNNEEYTQNKKYK